MYRVGLPFWKLVARLGVPLSLRIQVMRDNEADVYIATSTDLAGLVAEAPSLVELMFSVLDCSEMLIEHTLHRSLKLTAKVVWDGTVERSINFVTP
ncbi:MAG: DUF1902 domain-containing protein [Alcaligenaceae bacterium]|nr:DUF1902 domain-containing protein [Alcaligenaceae bacterium]